MEPYRYRILVCQNQKEGGKSCCQGRGADATFSALKDELVKRGLQFDVKVMASSCLDLCERGPNLVVYPQGTWYSGLTVEHVPEFVECQLVQGKTYAPKACDESELKDFFAKRKLRKMAEMKKPPL